MWPYSDEVSALNPCAKWKPKLYQIDLDHYLTKSGNGVSSDIPDAFNSFTAAVNVTLLVEALTTPLPSQPYSLFFHYCNCFTSWKLIPSFSELVAFFHCYPTIRVQYLSWLLAYVSDISPENMKAGHMPLWLVLTTHSVFTTHLQLHL